MLNLYPPFLFQGIRVRAMSPKKGRAVLSVRHGLFTRNLNGSIFGGSIFAAADPTYSILYWQVFARRSQRIEVWLKSAQIEYVKPARSRLELTFELTSVEIEEVAEELASEGRFVRRYSTDAIDREGDLCARIETEVYVRLPRTSKGAG